MTNGQRPAQGSAGPNQAAAVSPADSVRGLPTAPLLLVSPHLDDAMLSAFALLTGEPVDVLTVFTGRPVPAQHTGWDAICGFDDSTISITTRLGENEAAFAGWDHRLVELDLLDVQYRELDDGEFNHSSVITLLDPQGRVLARSSNLGGEPDAGFVETLRKALAAAP